WTVVVMYRRAFNAWWNIATGPHSRVRPLRDFPKRPTPADVEAILDDNGWGYTDRGDSKLLAGNMIDENWALALGGKPTRRAAGRRRPVPPRRHREVANPSSETGSAQAPARAARGSMLFGR